MDSKVKEIVSWFITLFFYMGVVLLIRIFIFNITAVDGLSMYPTLDHGDKLITQRVSLYFREAQPGEIVVIDAPDSEGDFYIKRVIGVEGDEISISNGDLYINGQIQEEDYINGNETEPNYFGQNHWLVPEDHVFVMGDNRGGSNDSRSFGPIHEDEVKGISEFRIYPFSKMGKL